MNGNSDRARSGIACRLRTLALGLFLLAPAVHAESGDWINFNDLVKKDGQQPSAAPEQAPAAEATAAAPEAAPAPSGPGSFSDVAEAMESAVGLVVMVRADGSRVQSATAWAVAPGVFATNGHVSRPVAEHLAAGGEAQVHLNNSSRRIFRIRKAVTHPGYSASANSIDVGILQVDGRDHAVWKVASREQLQDLGPGDAIGYYGFPTENLIMNNVNLSKPLASFQTGNVVAVSDFSLKDAGFEDNLFIRHSLPATGGASGSPIFLSDGTVVGLLNAGNINREPVLRQLRDGRTLQGSRRIPSAVQINFGIRVDTVNDLL